MRVRLTVMLLLAAALLLSGCRVSGEVENQAYVLVLGADRLADGRLELTARVPQIGKQAGGGEESGSGGGYLTFSGSGADYPQALEALEQATPRQMNLSHIELLVASEALAQETDFGTLVARIAETPHLYTTARFVVCEGSARDFIEAQEIVIGTRLSAEIEAMLGHYAERGFIPQSSFADAHYLSGSIYSDPVAVRGFTGPAEEAEPAAALIDPPEPTGASVAYPMKQRYSGAALFRGGSLAGFLDAGQTRLLNLIRGSRTSFPFECDGRSYTLTPEGSAARGVELDGDRAALSVKLCFNTLDDVCDEDLQRLEETLREALVEVVHTCQRLQTDPFGFAEQAARHFSTIQEWMAFGWRERYVDATVSVDVGIHGSGEG